MAMTDPYIIAAVALPRSDWLSRVGRWASSGALPIELTRCLSTVELSTLMASGKRLSAVLIDPTVPGADRDLIDAAQQLQIPTIAVTTRRTQRDLTGIGIAHILAESFTAEDLIGVLGQHSTPIARGTPRQMQLDVSLVGEPAAGALVSVVGSGGVGSSTIAMITAQTLATDSSPFGRKLSQPDNSVSRSVALVDGALRGNLSMYHDVGDIIPGVSELVELHRMDEPDPEAIRSLLFDIPERNYSLLLGMRRPRDWSTMRAASTRAAIIGLTRCYDTVVVDHDDNFDGEPETGSLDVEERHVIARHTLMNAQAVICVGTTGMKGIYDLSWLIQELARLGVHPNAIVPVINYAPRRPALRASLVRTLTDATGVATHPPIYVPYLHRMEDAQQSVAPLPHSRALHNALNRLLTTQRPVPATTARHDRIETHELTARSVQSERDEVA